MDEIAKKPCLTMLSTFTPESAREFVELERDVAIDTIRSLDKSENLVALIEWLLTMPVASEKKPDPESSDAPTTDENGAKGDTTPKDPPMNKDDSKDKKD